MRDVDRLLHDFLSNSHRGEKNFRWSIVTMSICAFLWAGAIAAIVVAARIR